MLTLKQGDFSQNDDGEFRIDPFNEFYDTDGIAKGIELFSIWRRKVLTSPPLPVIIIG